MDQTQVLDWDGEDDPDYSSNGAGDSGEPPKPVGRLHLLSNKYGPEKDFWIYPGENVIGRLESCQICLPASSVSKNHAVIEVPSPDGPHLLYDRGSLNKTRRQRLILKPEVRYSLQDGDALLFGDVGCQYFILALGGASESSDESMEVPPTQTRPNASAFVIEETPAPGKRLRLEGVLVQDSDKEEEGEDVVNGAGRKNGSDPAVDDGPGGPFKLASSMFSSPSAAVVPESDDESGEASVSELPCPSLRLCFESQDAEPGSLENGGVPPLNHERNPVQSGGAEIATKAQPDLGGRTAKNQEAPSVALAEGVHLDSDTDVDEEFTGGISEPSTSRCLPETSKTLEVGSDTDADEPVSVNPEPDNQKNHQMAIEVGSDTDVEEMVEDPNVPQTHQPAENGEEDTDAEEGTENPSMADPGGHRSGPQKESGCKDVREAKEDQDAAPPKGCPLDEEEEDSDTDVEGAIGDSDAKAQKLLENRDSDTDVDDASPKRKNPDGALKTQESACDRDSNTVVDDAAGAGSVLETLRDSDGDTDVEMSDLVLENSDVARTQGPHPLSSKDSSACVEEIPLKGVVHLDSRCPGQGPGVEADSPIVEFKGNQEAVSEASQSFDRKKPLENPKVVKDTTVSSQKPGLPVLSVDSDTDVEDEVENLNGGSEEGHKAASVGPGRGGRGSFLENSGAGSPQSPMADGVGDSDTDVEGASPSHKESMAQDSDTDVEEATVPLVPGGTSTAGRELAASVAEVRVRQEPCKGNENPGAEENEAPPADDGSNTDDDPDLAFQATQCFLPPETSSPMPEKAHNTTGADSSTCLEEEATQAFLPQSPSVATKLPLRKACSSPLKEDNQDPGTYMLEATQLFCQDLEPLSEEPTQAFVAPEEEETELISQSLREEGGGRLHVEGTVPALSTLASRGQQATRLSATLAKPSSLRSSPSELVAHTVAEGGVDKPEKEAEPERARSVPVPSSSSSSSSESSALPEVVGNFESEAQVSAEPSEAGSTAGLPPPGSGEAGVHHHLEEKSSTLAREEAKDVSKQVPDRAKPELASVSGRRRSQRLSSTAAATSPASVPEGRSLRRRGPAGSDNAGGSREPAASLSRRRGLRQLSSASQFMGEPEAKEVQPEKEDDEEEEEAHSRKKPRHGEPAVVSCPSRAKVSPGDSDAASRLKGEAAIAAGSLGTRELSRRGKSRAAAAEPGKEQPPERPQTRAGRRSNSTSSPKDSGKDAKPRQESPAQSTPSSGRRLRLQSAESKSGGTRAQPQKRTQGPGTPAPKVLFTGVIDEEGERVVTTLGGSLAESVFDCTHLVTDRVRRTVKFLCALARGIPIVTPDWLEKSRQNSFFLMPTSFLVHDPEQEKNFGFSLTASLQRAQQEGGLFQGYEIHVTPNVKPEPEHMRDIVKCSGGTFLPRMPRAYKDKRVVVSCPDDLSRCKPAQDAGIPIANSEFILTGLLQQCIDLEAHQLEGVGASPTPTTRASKRRAVAPTAPPSTAKRRR
uniref:Mediator of DNA damage checkpoint protein 1 n=1 Tax=Pogona vitticeps TaxID=103695 RepID=A0ABM5FIJ3_9SAUR